MAPRTDREPVATGPLIDAVGLERRFGATIAVADVSLRVAGGEILALLGPNGAGKTTTMQMLAGLLPPTAGHATVAGHDVARAADRVRTLVGLMVDEPGFYPEMTIEEYLFFMARLYRLTPAAARAAMAALLERFGLVPKRRARLSSLSKGMRQKVALIRAVIHQPPVLLLDEPTSALDPLSARAVHEYIRERRAAGDAVIISTHNLPEAEVLADRVAIMAAGRLRRQGACTELCRAPNGLHRFMLTLAGPPAEMTTTLLERLPGLTAVTPVGPVPVGLWQPGQPGQPGQPEEPGYQISYATATPERSNAAVTAAMARHGVAVLALEPRPDSLGAVYIRAMEDAA